MSTIHPHLLTLLLAAFIFLDTAEGVSPYVSFNQKYINTLRVAIDTSSFGNESAAPWNSLTYNKTYPITTQSQPKKSLFLTMEGLYITPQNNQLELAGQLGTVSDSFLTILVNSTMPNHLQLLNYRVMIITADYSAWNNSNIMIVETTILTNKNISSNTSHQETIALASALNSSGTLKSFVSLVGFNVTSTGSNLLDLGYQIEFNHTHLNFSILSSSYQPTFAYSLRASVLIFNIDYYYRSSYAEIYTFNYYGNLSVSSIYRNYYSGVYEHNNIVGFSKIKTSQNFLNFNVEFQTTSGIYITSTNLPNQFKLNVLELETYYCPYQDPYYFQNNCYSTCPSGSFPNNPTLTCIPCSAGLFLYNQQCVSTCPTTYFPNSITSTCQSCQSHCNQCLSVTSCQQCIEGYYLYQNNCFTQCPTRTVANSTSGSCINCPYDCYSCTIIGLCISCSSTDFRELMGGRCIPIQGYFDSGESISSKCPVGCSSCTSSTQCIDSTTSQSSSSSFPIYLLIVSIIGGVLVAIVVIVSCWKYRKSREGPHPPQDDGIEVSEQRLRIDWSKQNFNPTEECIICLCDHTTFLTACGHSYHMECIVAWRQNSCPLCRRTLFDQMHKMICRRCMGSYQLMTFKQMMIMVKNGRFGESMCEDCNQKNSL